MALVLAQFSKKYPCYYCGASAPSSREHAPPQLMFRDFECDSIVVPACDKHNAKKSGLDQAVDAYFVVALNQVAQHMTLSLATDNVRTALARAERKLKEAKGIQLAQVLESPPPELNVLLPYREPSININEWMCQLTAAMFWTVTGAYDPCTRWETAWVWSPREVLGPSDPRDHAELARQLLRNLNANGILEGYKWHPGWTPKPTPYPPDIYRFDIHFLQWPTLWDGKNVVVKHIFYNNFEWYVWVQASHNTRNVLRRMTRKMNR